MAHKDAGKFPGTKPWPLLFAVVGGIMATVFAGYLQTVYVLRPMQNLYLRSYVKSRVYQYLEIKSSTYWLLWVQLNGQSRLANDDTVALERTPEGRYYFTIKPAAVARGLECPPTTYSWVAC